MIRHASWPSSGRVWIRPGIASGERSSTVNRLTVTKSDRLTNQDNLSDKQPERLEAIFYSGLQPERYGLPKNSCETSGYRPPR